MLAGDSAGAQQLLTYAGEGPGVVAAAARSTARSIDPTAPRGARRFEVQVDFDLLRQAPETFEILTPDGEIVNARLVEFKDRGEGDFLWSGHAVDADGVRTGVVVLSMVNGGISGVFDLADGTPLQVHASEAEGFGLVLEPEALLAPIRALGFEPVGDEEWCTVHPGDLDEPVTAPAAASAATTSTPAGLGTAQSTLPAITLTVSPEEVMEDAAAPVEITVTATIEGTDRFFTDQAIRISVGGGTSAPGTDFTAVADFDLVIPAGDAARSATFDLAPVNDEVAEPHETIRITGLLPGVNVAPAEIELLSDDKHQIDVIVFYTDYARLTILPAQTDRRLNDMTRNATWIFDYSSRMLQDAGVAAEYNVVHIGQAPNDVEAALGRGTRAIQTIRDSRQTMRLRDDHDADIVHMVGCCDAARWDGGQAYWRHSVHATIRQYARHGQNTTNLGRSNAHRTTAHELAHTLGGLHERGEAGQQVFLNRGLRPLTPYVYGHWNAAARTRTILAYGGSQPRNVSHYATARRTFDGHAIGEVDRSEVDRLLRRTAPETASLSDWIAPGPPSGIKGTAMGDGNTASVNLTWTDESKRETAQRIEYKTRDAAEWSTAVTVEPNVEQATITGLLPGTRYDFRIRALNHLRSWPSTTLTIATPNAGPPSRPTNLRATAPADATVRLTWNDNSHNETGFDSTYRTYGAPTWTAGPSVAANVKTVDVTGLLDDTEYEFRVGATNAAGTTWSDAVALHTNVPGAPPPPDAPLEPGELLGRRLTATSVWLEWIDRSGDDETGFAVEVRPDGGDDADWSEVQYLPANVETTIVAGLPEDAALQFRIVAIGGPGAFSYSDLLPLDLSAEPPPAADLAGEIERDGSNYYADLQWTIDRSYKIVGAPQTTDPEWPYGRFRLWHKTSTVDSWEIDEYWRSQKYQRLRVESYDHHLRTYRIETRGKGGSTFSNEIELDFNKLPPAAVKKLKAVVGALPTEAKLTWNTAKKATGYRVSYTFKGNEQIYAVYPPDVTEANVTGLEHGSYTFTVASLSSTGYHGADKKLKLPTPRRDRDTPPEAARLVSVQHYYRSECDKKLQRCEGEAPDPKNGETEATPFAPPLSQAIQIRYTDLSKNEHAFRAAFRKDDGDWRYADNIPDDPTTKGDTIRAVWAGLEPRTVYHFRVLAHHDERGSHNSEFMTLYSSQDPGNVTVTPTGSESVEVTWTDRATQETRFVVQYKGQSGDWTDGGTTGSNRTKATVNKKAGLQAGATYEFRVRARIETAFDNYWEESEIVEATMPPPAPTGVTATAMDSTTANVGWTHASSAVGFVIEARLAGDDANEWSTHRTAPAGATSAEVGNLTPSATHEIRVRAEHQANGRSSPSDAATVTMPPAAPSGLVATVASATSVTLTWVDESSDETEFVAEYMLEGDVWQTFMPPAATNATTLTVTSLAGGNYEFLVRARNGNGVSSPSNVARVASLGAPLAATGLAATATGPTTVDLTWADNSSDETGFDVEHRKNGRGDWASATSAAANATAASVTGLAPSTVYEFRVGARNANGVAPGDPVTLTMPPREPRQVAAVAEDSTSVLVTWVDHSRDETGFAVAYRTGGGAWSSPSTVNPNVERATVRNLVPSTQYEFRVSATSDNGDSHGSIVSLTMPPAAPTNLVATEASATSVTLTWADNSSDETGFLIEYRIYRSADLWSTYGTEAAANATTITVSGLVAGTGYEFRVLAKSAAGPHTPSDPAVTEPLGGAAAPTNVTATATGSTSATVTWTDNANDETGFLIEWRIGNDLWTPAAAAAPDETSVHVGHLFGSRMYDFRVAATNAEGPGWSAPATLTLPPPAPTELAAAMASMTSATLTWTDNSADETGFVIEYLAANTLAAAASAVDAPSAPSEAGLAGVSAGQTSTTWTTFGTVAAADAETIVVTGLASNTPYAFRVRANHGTNGMSSPSNLIWLNQLAPSCAASSAAVTETSPTDASALAADCAFLLDTKATLEGSAPTKALNWSATLSMSSWDGITIASDRVSQILLGAEWGLSGTLPASLPRLSGLQSFRIPNGQLTGGLPAFPASLRNLDLSQNRLSGTLPDFNGLSNLIEIRLNQNGFTGSVPTAARLPSTLTHLEFVDNALSGAIPDLSGLGSLVQLDLTGNDLTGGIPALPASLVALRLTDNDLNGAIGDLRGMTALRHLHLNDNGFSGAVPGNLPTGLQQLYIRNNALDGSTFPDLSSLSSLSDVRLDGNALTGSVPPDDLLPPNLRILLLYNNSLSGAIPDLSDLSSLALLYVQGNDLTGAIPAATMLPPNVQRLVLSGNALDQEIPDLNALASLAWFYATDNALAGDVPTAARLPAGIQRIALGGNALTGSIQDFSTRTSLTHLYLQGNALSGAIPTTLPASLQVLHLGGNDLANAIPSQLDGLTALTELSLCDNDLTGALPSALETKRTANPATLTVFSCAYIEDAAATEGTPVEFTVTHDTFPVLGSAAAADLALSWETADDTATSSDYTATAGTPGSVTIAGNTDTATTSSSATISVATTEDTAVEGNEAFTVGIALPDPLPSGLNVLLTEASAIGTIEDDDMAANPTVELSVTAGGAVTEGGTLTLTATLSAAPSANVSVPIQRVAANSTAAAGDYSLSPASITVASGARTGTATLTAATDTADEQDEPLRLALGTVSGHDHGSAAHVDIVITDNTATTVTLSVEDAQATEGTASATAGIRLTLGRGLVSGEALAVPLSFSGGTAGTDFTLALSGSPTGVTFASSTSTVTFTGPQSGTTATVANVTLTPEDDDDANDRTVTVTTGRLTATNLDGGASGSGNGEITIADDETERLVFSRETVSVTEGSEETYTVKLGSAPTASVEVTISGQSGTDLSVDTDSGTDGNQTSLTFTTSNWNNAQTVTVTAAEDDDAAKETAITLSHSASGGGYGSVTGNVTVNITDDDDPKVNLSVNNSGAVTEAGTLTITAAVSQAPAGSSLAIPVQRVSANSTAVAADFSLNGTPAGTITVADGATTGSITLTATNDSADEAAETLRLELGTLPSGYERGATPQVDIVITDNDATTVTLSVPDAAATEGTASATAGIRVTLGRGLVAGEALAVPLTFAGGTAGTDFTLALSGSPTGVTFASGTSTVTFTGPQSGATATTANLTLTPADDDDAEDRTVTVSTDTLTATNLDGGTSASRTGNGEITITDDETQRLVFSRETVSVTEASEETYTVKLGSAPTASVEVTISGHASTDLTVDTDSGTDGNQTSLTFTTSNWNSAQTVTVTAGEDDDAANEAAITLSHSASGGGYGSVSGNVTVNITDNDAKGLTFSSTAVSVTEGSGATYTVRLATAPTSNVTVTVSGHGSTDLTVDTDSGTNGNQTSLTFTTSNWNNAQTVTVTAAEDDDTSNETAITLAHAASGGGYNGVSGNVTVNITDNDEPKIDLSVNNSGAVTEAGTLTITAAVSQAPAGSSLAIPVQRVSANSTAVAADFSLNGTPAGTITVADGATTGSITLTATNDSADEAAETLRLELGTLPSGYERGATPLVDIVITDNDATTVTLSVPDTEATEGTASATAGIRVTLGRGLVSGEALAVPLTFAGGTAGTDFTLALSGSPTGVTFASGTSTVTFTGPQSGATATTANLTLTPADDDDAEDRTVTVSVSTGTLTATSLDGGASGSGSGQITISDDETQRLVFSRETVSVTEASEETYTVKLGSAPTASVEVTISGHASTDLTVDTDSGTDGNQTSLTFTTSNWNSAQTVTVTAGEDDDAANEAAITLSHSASGGGYGSVSGNVTVNITDNDAKGLTFSSTAVSVTEGSGATYTVRLATAPTSSVTVTVSGHGSTDLTVDTDSGTNGNQTTLTFTTSTWNSAQTVTVTAAEDDDTTNETAITLAHAASGGGYNGVSGNVTVNITDDDNPLVNLSVNNGGAVTEAGTLTITAEVSQAPAGRSLAIPVQRVAANSTAVAADFSLNGTPAGTITVADGATTGSITLTATNDSADEVAETLRLELGTLPTGYARGATPHVDIVITDNDATTVTLSVPDGQATEGNSSATAGIRLTLGRGLVAGEALAVPLTFSGGTAGTDFTLALSGSPTGVTFASGTSTVTFTGPQSGTTATTANLTLTPADDDDANDRTVTVSTGTLTATNLAGGASGSGSGQITISDDETQRLVFSRTTVPVTEGSEATYTVRLATAPTSSVTVTVSGHGSTDLTVDTDSGTNGNQTTLTFTTSTWNSAQTVTVTAAEDDDTTNETAITLAHAASGGGYGSVTGNVTVNIMDDDDPPTAPSAPTGVTVSATGSTSVSVRWTDASSDETSFRVEYRTGSNSWTTGTTTGADATSATVGGLSASTSYDFRVASVNSVGSSESSASSLTMPPAAPSGLAASTSSPGSVALSWTDNSSDETGFLVEYRAAGDLDWTQFATRADANATSLVVTGLTSGTAYRFRVSATSANGLSSPSNEAFVGAAAVPLPPTDVTVSATGSTSVSVTWTDASTDEAGFRVEYRTGSDSWATGATTLADATSATVGGLAPSTAYDVRVVSVNANGSSESAASSLVMPPAAVSDLSGSAVDAVTVTLQWTDDSSDATSFVVEYRAARTEDWTVFPAEAPAGSTTTSVTGLAAGTSHDFRVYAKHGTNGLASPSDVIRVGAFRAPVPPTNVAAAPAGGSAVRLTWTDTSDDETGFEIEYREANPGVWRKFETEAPADAESIVVTGLAADTSYEFRVLAKSAAGLSSPSPVGAATTGSGGTVEPPPPTGPPAPPPNRAPFFDPATPVEFTVVEGTTGAVGSPVAASDPDGDAISYLLRGEGASAFAVNNETGQILVRRGVTLDASLRSSYAFSVIASDGALSASREVTVEVVEPRLPGSSPIGRLPDPPTELAATLLTSEVVVLTWLDRADDESGFEVHFREGTGGWEQVRSLPANVETATVEELAGGIEYEFVVLAVNRYGRTASEVVAIELSLAPPTHLDAVPLGETSARVVWRDNATAETGYEVQLRRVAADDADDADDAGDADGEGGSDGEGGAATGWTAVATVGANSAAAVLEGLAPGASYRFRVAALGQGGTALSGTARFTLAEPPLDGANTNCVPTGNVATLADGYDVRMCVEMPSGAQVDASNYHLESRASGLLYFFDRDNVEVLVKVLDGCAINGHRWVFIAPVTTLAFHLEIVERSTGNVFTHRNPRSVTAATVSDTTAFACDPAAAATAGTGLTVGAAGGADAGRVVLEASETPVCEPDGPGIELESGHRIDMCFATPDGGVLAANDWGLAPRSAALLHFFDRENAEVLVKVLDGCAVNGHHWVFAAPATDLAFHLVVTAPDGQRWTHRNSAGQTAEPRSDTAAFPCR